MKHKFLIMVTALTMSVTPFALGTASAACGNSNSAKGQVLQGVGQTGNCSDSGINNVIKAVVSLLSLAVGIVAVIMIIVAGFKYITSAGDSAGVGNAKNTLIYALVGIAVAALAQFMVHFVLFQTSK